jgi:hypothetical protein
MINSKSIKGFKLKSISQDDRKSRGKEQKIFLIMTHEYENDDMERSYAVMGTTGNVYTVTIKNKPTCTCPDFTIREKRCKHIYFVLTRIMKVSEDREDIDTYSDDDLIDMFSKIPHITDNLRVESSKLDLYKSMKKNKNGEVTMKEITEEDLCPICLDEMYECGEEITYCKYSCGACIHRKCFDMFNSKQTGDIKCLYCHKIWYDKKEYLNIQVSKYN